MVEFNDVDALEQVLREEEIACVMTEPALTNIGIVLPEPGFHDALRELTRATGTLLLIDETHTFSAGPGGYTAAHGLEPDLLTIGKAIAGGVPAGAFGMSAEVATRVGGQVDADYEDTGGVGGTLAGNALSAAAIRATLDRVLTDEAFERMIEPGGALHRGSAGRDRRDTSCPGTWSSSAPGPSTASCRSPRSAAGSRPPAAIRSSRSTSISSC